MTVTTRRLGATAFCATVACLLAPSGAAAAERPGTRAEGAASRSVVVTSVIDRRARRSRIGRSFVGLSLEYGDALEKSGVARTGTNPVFVALLKELARTRNGPVPLRIGGGSTDVSWWNPEGAPRSRGLELDLGEVWADGVSRLVRQTGSKLILGLNFAHGDPALALDMAEAATERFGRRRIIAFEIGNEPENLAEREYGRDANGRRLYARPPGWDFRDYLSELHEYVVRLRRSDRRIRLAAPVSTCAPVWCFSTPSIVRRERRAIKAGNFDSIAFHQYPLCDCPGSPKPTIRTLLSDHVVLNWARNFARIAREARRGGLPLRVTETNSAAGGGTPGVTNTFASSLWGADWLFSLAFAGAKSAHLHASSPWYSPFSFGYSRGQWAGRVHPLYYGMLLFTRATANGARLLPGATFATRRSRKANMRIWATVDRRRTVRVVVLNKDLRRRALVRLKVPGGRRTATVERLTGPSVDAKTGIRLAGQTHESPTTDGRLVGRRRTGRSRPRRGTYRVSVPATSAALVTIRGVR